MQPIVSAQQLLQINASIRLIDARSGPAAREAYLDKHLAGAVYADLETDLANKKENAAEGGRHPLPSAARFAQLLGQWGIAPDTHVVIYDDKNGANAAARCWWMLRAMGHEKAQVLDRGFDAAVAAGFPTAAGEETPAATLPYPAVEWQWPTADIDEVAAAAQDPARMVIDVREAPRYRGEREPIDLIAGHIPGAVNIPFAGNLDENGAFLSPETLADQYKEAIGARRPDQIIVHCGSGVTACHTLLAMAHAGMPPSKLYVGSWSEWSRNDRPIGKNE